MPAQETDSQPNAWWTTLRHGGVLVSPIVLEEKLPEGPASAGDYEVDRLRRAYAQFARDPEREISAWLDAVFETFLGHTAPNWQKGQNVSDKFRHTDPSGQVRKPTRVLLNALKEHEPRFLVLVDKDRFLKDDGTPGQIAVHGGRRTYGQFLSLLRATNVKLGILTNGFQFRLIYAGLDTEAWTEWSAPAWFEGGDGRRALDGLRSLAGVERIPPDGSTIQHALLDIVEDSRKRQADLSHVMGTQVREAVEILLNSLDNTLATATPEERDALLAPLKRLGLQRQVELDSLYQAAIRVVMRLVVTAYAESRTLFPTDQVAYLQSYSLEVLFRQLQQAKVEEGIEVLHQQEGAWPRIVSQARLVHTGSRHKGLQMVAYGGRLFQAPTPDTTDPVLAALSILESPDVRVSDATVHQMLELLKIGKFKSGRGKPLKGPVDFSDLRTEYIGMMYEGLLDYQLREARAEDGGIVFLNLGDQPALPLRVLTALSDDRLKKLIAELKKKTKGKSTDDEPDEEPEEDGADDEETEADATEDALIDADEPVIEAEAPIIEAASPQERFEADVMEWAMRAVRLNPAIFLPPKARKEKDPTLRRKAEQVAARRLILKSIRPGGTYLVRWSGTRKGTGTFYTKPALAVPTVNRTLEPLVYLTKDDGTRVPKTPEEILALKVCDPAMGSGSFLVAALRYLTRALQESFEHHVFQAQPTANAPVTVVGTRAEGLYRERLLPLRQAAAEHRGDGPDPNARIESELKRGVVEHCIYGVDLNPLAVELGKLSLWVETMDPQLTFAFLDHKIKCGNSLIGAWRVQAEHYPLGAWERELGDGKNNPRTKRLQRIRKEIVVPEMQRYLEQFDIRGGGEKKVAKAIKAIPGQRTLTGEAMAPVQARFVEEQPVVVKKYRVATITEPSWEASPEEVAEYTRDVYAKMHASLDATEQEQEFRKLLSNAGYQRQKFLLDMWCAAWFWPIRSPETAALDAEPLITPSSYLVERERGGALSAMVRATIDIVAEQFRFFHWEIEYPDVFDATQGRFGFDATVGNPPWETAKPQDNEFFTQYDPAYRTYGKQDGLKRQKEIFAANPAIVEDFWSYQESYKAQSNFVRNSRSLDSARLGGPKYNDKWEGITRASRDLLRGVAVPYAHQGSGDLNLYKLFVERALVQTALGGRIGLILPSGIYSDYGTRDLRRQLYDANTWEWVFSFENKRKIFAIHASFKFAVVIIRRGHREAPLRCHFLEHEKEAWGVAYPPHLEITPAQIRLWSPDSLNILEIDSETSAKVIAKMYASSPLGRDHSWQLKWIEDIHTSKKSEFYVPIERASAAGWTRVGSTRWLTNTEEPAVPVYTGTMISHFNPSFRAWRGGEWEAQPIGSSVEPKFLMTLRAYSEHGRPQDGAKLGYRKIARATDRRTMISTVIPDFPVLDSMPIIRIEAGEAEVLALCAVFNSYAFDFVMRNRLGGTNLQWYNIAETPVAAFAANEADRVVRAVSKVAKNPHVFENDQGVRSAPLTEAEWWAVREEIDELVSEAFGLSYEDMRWILRPDSTDPRNLWRDYLERLKILEAAGIAGRWYSLSEARKLRESAGLRVDF